MQKYKEEAERGVVGDYNLAARMRANANFLRSHLDISSARRSSQGYIGPSTRSKPMPEQARYFAEQKRCPSLEYLLTEAHMKLVQWDGM